MYVFAYLFLHRDYIVCVILPGRFTFNKTALHVSTYKSTSCSLTVSVFDAEGPTTSFITFGIGGIWVVSSIELLQ